MNPEVIKDKEKIKLNVRENYGKIALLNTLEQNASCCGSAVLSDSNLSLEMGYSTDEISNVPDGANMGLGCGNPHAIASIKPEETVLDLGSGGGFDCFLASKQVGSKGLVIGVDMTPEMITKARNNAKNANYSNVEFRLGEIEYLPVADNTIDVIISNCVINLSTDKSKVFKEAYRVLKNGGRLAISDVVAFAEIPNEYRDDLNLYSCCVSGASQISDLEEIIREAGFSKILIKPKDESKSFMSKWTSDKPITDFVISASIEAIKI